MDAPKSVLVDDKMPAVVLLEALEQVIPEALLHWEPESMWLELERGNADVPIANRARIGAGIAVLVVPAFYWDAVVFEKTALSFDGHPPHPDILEEATPAQMAWAVVEAGLIRKRWGHHTVEFRQEPIVYAATVLHRDGFVRAPEQLAFAQDLLNGMNGDVGTLRDDVDRRWREGVDAKDTHFEETPVGVQLARLAAVRLHVEERRSVVARYL